MSERPRYLTDEEAKYDGCHEGYGAHAEVASTNRTGAVGREFISIVRTNTYLETAMEEFAPIIERAKGGIQQSLPIEQKNDAPPNYMDIFMRDFTPIIEQAKRGLLEDDYGSMQMETDGCTVFSKASNISPEESPK